MQTLESLALLLMGLDEVNSEVLLSPKPLATLFTNKVRVGVQLLMLLELRAGFEPRLAVGRRALEQLDLEDGVPVLGVTVQVVFPLESGRAVVAVEATLRAVDRLDVLTEEFVLEETFATIAARELLVLVRQHVIAVAAFRK